MIENTNKWAIQIQTAFESEAMQLIAGKYGYRTLDPNSPVESLVDFISGIPPYIVFDPETKSMFSSDNPDPYVSQIVNRIEDAMNLLKKVPGNFAIVGELIAYASGNVGHTQYPFVISSESFEKFLATRREILTS
jgi:hypothetical protein